MHVLGLGFEGCDSSRRYLRGGIASATFYQDRFGIPNAIETYRSVAALMRSLDRIPEELRDLGAQLELMASEQD